MVFYIECHYPGIYRIPAPFMEKTFSCNRVFNCCARCFIRYYLVDLIHPQLQERSQQIKVDTTDFSRLDWEKLFLQIASWMKKHLHV